MGMQQALTLTIVVGRDEIVVIVTILLWHSVGRQRWISVTVAMTRVRVGVSMIVTTASMGMSMMSTAVLKHKNADHVDQKAKDGD